MKILLIAFASVMLIHCSIGKKSITHVTLHEKSDSLLLKSSASFAVEIPLQSGTGYSWEFDALSVQSRLLSKSTASLPATDSLPGGTMLEVFTFKAPSGLKEETLTFTLRRPWEKNNAPAEVRVLKLKRL